MSLAFTVLLRHWSRRQIGRQCKPPPQSLLLNLRPFSKGYHHVSVAITRSYAVSAAKHLPNDREFCTWPDGIEGSHTPYGANSRISCGSFPTSDEGPSSAMCPRSRTYACSVTRSANSKCCSTINNEILFFRSIR